MGEIKYIRNKTVSVHRAEDGCLKVHGLLDDDIYSLELDISYRLPELEIVSIEGRWNRWTTPECPRALGFLEEALGLVVGQADFDQTVHKAVGRKSCRHFANLLLECSHSAREAARMIKGEPAAGIGREAEPVELAEKKEKDASPPKEESGPVRIEAAGRQPSPDAGQSRDGGTVLDLHLHTSPASPCSSVSVDLIIKQAQGIGLDGICLTDHNYFWPAREVEELRQKYGYLILRGNEIITDQGDILVFGLEDEIKGVIALSELRTRVDRAKGFMVAAHPFRGFLVFGAGQLGLTREKAMARPMFKLVDAVEVLNGKVTAKENQLAREVAEGLGLPATGGSDAHEMKEVGQYATRFKGAIKNEQDLLQALLSGDFEPMVFRG